MNSRLLIWLMAFWQGNWPQHYVSPVTCLSKRSFTDKMSLENLHSRTHGSKPIILCHICLRNCTTLEFTTSVSSDASKIEHDINLINEMNENKLSKPPSMYGYVDGVRIVVISLASASNYHMQRILLIDVQYMSRRWTSLQSKTVKYL